MKGLKQEYLEILDKIDRLMEIFNKLEEHTKFLKLRYKENPDDENLKDEVKKHQENYKLIYEQISNLSKKAEELKKRYTENN